jgi:hypothetical protein
LNIKIDDYFIKNKITIKAFIGIFNS